MTIPEPLNQLPWVEADGLPNEWDLPLPLGVDKEPGTEQRELWLSYDKAHYRWGVEASWAGKHIFGTPEELMAVVISVLLTGQWHDQEKL